MAKVIGRNGELFRELCDPAHLIRSARAAAKGKKRRPDAASFLLDMEPECFRLARELAEGSWTPGAYHTFVIKEPKPRLISAAPFRDRVVHHALGLCARSPARAEQTAISASAPSIRDAPAWTAVSILAARIHIVAAAGFGRARSPHLLLGSC
jgi:hypothetical protein